MNQLYRTGSRGRLCRGIALLIAGVLIAAATPARAMEVGAVPLPNSVKPVPEAPVGSLDAHKAFVTRSVLKDAEKSAVMEFEVALKMRNFAQLSARVAGGERISRKEMAERYEPTAHDYEAAAAWLVSNGFVITRRDSHHIAIFARGKVSTIQSAMGVAFARVSLEGKEYTSAVTAPNVPASLAPSLVGINGLQPHVRAHKHIIRKQDTPNVLSGGASYFPSKIAAAYDATALYNSNLTGSGEAIAIVIDTFPASSDLQTFWKNAGVSQSIGNISFIQVVSGALPKPSGEETLDTEWASSIAPSARVRVYATTDLGDSELDQAYERIYEDVTQHPDLGIHQMSMSYGEGESYTTQSQVDTDDQYFAELASAGVTVFASSGDAGSTPGPNGTGDESGSVQVESPASDPNVTGVGGTTLVLSASDTVTSESVWNENGGAGGGGVSIYFKKPAWQTGTGVMTGAYRQVPDVACSADPQYGAIIVQSGSQQTVGGTSWSSPTWAGFCALINQARASSGQESLGLLGPQIYPLLSAPNYPSTYMADFRDVTSGNNATRRSGGDYAATPGFDLCTGVGTPKVQPLAQLLASASGLVGIQGPVAVESVLSGQNASYTVTVTGSSATYQWQIEPIGASAWTNLTDDGTYSGSTGPTLTISDVTPAMSGDQFQCIVLIGTSSITTSPPSVLVVDSPLSIATVAGRSGTTGLVNGSGSTAEFNYPSGVAVDGSGNVYIADYGNNEIRKVTPAGTVSTPYGSLTANPGSTNASGNSALFNSPNGVTVDGSNNLYVCDTGNNLIRKITPAGVVSTLAGSGGQFNSPEGVAVDATGNVYVADTNNNVIRKVTPAGAVSTLAGQVGQSGSQDGAAGSALFNGPTGVAVDGSGNVYVADFGNSVVRKISGGQVTTVAGQQGQAGYLDGLGGKALFNAPISVWADGSGNVYIADTLVPDIGSVASGNTVLRELSSTGVVSTIAGDPGTTGATNGIGSAARFYSPQSVTESASGQFYIADTYNQIIRTGSFSSGSADSTTRIVALSGTLAFGDVIEGGSAAGEFVIENTGNTGLTVSGISYPSGFTGDWASGTIPADESQVVTVTFAPGAATSYGGNIIVASDATSGGDSIAVSGTGVAALVNPAVVTGGATEIGGASATLTGTANAEGSSTGVHFQYGLTASYGMVTGTTNIGVGTGNVAVSTAISGLEPLTTYHFQAVASSAGGTVYGGDQTFTTRPFATVPVVATGGSAAGVVGAEYLALGNPAISGSDYVAFRATLHGNVKSNNNLGVWAQNSSGTQQLIARTGGLAPGAGNGVFMALSNPVANDNQAVAFYGTLAVLGGEATAATASGIWSNVGGPVALVARQGDQAPGFGAGITFQSFNSLALTDTGGVIFLATASNGQRAIWSGTSAATLQLLVKQGEEYNGSPIETLSFLPALGFVNGQTRSFAQSGGMFACLTTFHNGMSGILKVTGTDLEAVALSGSSAPGASGAVFQSFGNPALNAGGYVAFRAKISGTAAGITSKNNFGIWADDGAGSLQLIAQTESPAPNTTGTFLTLNDPVYNDNGAVAFRGTLKVPAGSGFTGAEAGIWSDSAGPLTLVAHQGGQAAGCPVGATFAAFTELGLPDQGGVVFYGRLNSSRTAGVTSVNNAGIWAVDTTGTLQLIVRKGDVVGGKRITALSFLPLVGYVAGQTRNFSQQTGDLTYQATFSDGSTAISVVRFP